MDVPAGSYQSVVAASRGTWWWQGMLINESSSLLRVIDFVTQRILKISLPYVVNVDIICSKKNYTFALKQRC